MTPQMIAIRMTNPMYVRPLFFPMILVITSMLGRLSAGPESSMASAGPLPMPCAMRRPTIGTSVSVEKYMNAPDTEATEIEDRLSPPRNIWIY